MTIVQFLNAHKTKILGGVVVILGAIQANEGQIQAFISPKQYGLANMGLGVLVAIFGFINSAAA